MNGKEQSKSTKKYEIGDSFLLKAGNGSYIRAKIVKYLGKGFYDLEGESLFPMTLSEKSIEKMARPGFLTQCTPEQNSTELTKG